MLSDTSPEAAVPRWKPTHMPRLSYRNAEPGVFSQLVTQQAATSDCPPSSSETILSGSSIPKPPSLTGGDGPRSTEKHSVNRPPTGSSTKPSISRSSNSSVPPTKKKGSLFGGLFVKEPSSIALEQLAQKLVAEHGELSPRAIPGVSMTKMPANVPKVNTKWDGVPKAKDGRGREARVNKTPSSGSSVRSRSTEPPDRDRTASRSTQPHRRLSNSTSPHSQNRAATRPRTQHSASEGRPMDTGLPNPTGESSTSQKKRRASTMRPQSLRTPSGSSLPEITSFFPNEIPDPPPIPTRFKGGDGQVMRQARSHPLEPANLETISSTPEPLQEDQADHASSFSGTSSDASPLTPFSTYTSEEKIGHRLIPSGDHVITGILRPKSEDVLLKYSGKDVLDPTVRTRRRTRPPTDAFLAGEARPLEIADDRIQQDLERRPDTSRARLGLRASMKIDTDELPWEAENTKRDGNARTKQFAPSSSQTPSTPKPPNSPKFLRFSLANSARLRDD